jgi:hypothetical protein
MSHQRHPVRDEGPFLRPPVCDEKGRVLQARAYTLNRYSFNADDTHSTMPIMKNIPALPLFPILGLSIVRAGLLIAALIRLFWRGGGTGLDTVREKRHNHVPGPPPQKK